MSILRGRLGYLNQFITTIIMARLVKVLSTGLITTGLSIILFNQQPYDRQQHIIALYQTAKNSARTIHYLYSLHHDFKQLLDTDINADIYRVRLEDFKNKSAEKIQELCAYNKGVYARMGQLLSRMTGVLPEQYLSSFKKLDNLTTDESSYDNVKNALVDALQKPMKDIFDAFQTKPLSVNLFWQTHKSILLQNYKQSLVKVMLPSVRYQSQHDFWFINKVIGYIEDYIKQHRSQYIQRFNEYSQVIKEAEEITKEEIDFKREIENADKLGDLIFEPNSAFYIPYYYNKYATNSTIIRQFVEGVTIDNLKGLKEIGLTPEVAYAYMMSSLHRVMNKYSLISGRINEHSLLIRKYIKPAKRKESQEVQNEAVKKNRAAAAKTQELLHPHYQVVLLSLNNLQSLPQNTRDTIQNYWVNIKKSKKPTLPSIKSFYDQIPNLNNLKDDSTALLREKYFLYEPMLALFEKFVRKQDSQASKVK